MAGSRGLDPLVSQILAATLVLVTAGCSYQENWTGPAHRVPVSLVGPTPHEASTHSAPAPTVTVSVICSDGWQWVPLAMTSNTPSEEVQIDRIEFINPDRPTLYVPLTGSRLIWVLAFGKSELPGFAIFRPGYDPAFQLCPSRDPAVGITWDPTLGLGRVVYAAQPLGTTASTSPALQVPNDPPAADPFARLIADRPFWRALRSRYESGADRAAITVICQATLLAATHHPTTDRKGLDDAGTLDWCRSVASRR